MALGLAAAVRAENPEPVAADSHKGGHWEYGPFLQGGSGIGERSDFQFFAAGFQTGIVLTPVVHAGWLSGSFELGANVQPVWLGFTPAPHTDVVNVGDIPTTVHIGGGTFTGVSVTPVVFRWNLATRSQKWMPWVQAAGGVIYTTHRYPPTIAVPHGTPGGTSIFNFSPQGGVGVHYFLKPHRSVDFALNAEHISSASLGDRNPGVNASLQVVVGYTWWK